MLFRDKKQNKEQVCNVEKAPWYCKFGCNVTYRPIKKDWNVKHISEFKITCKGILKEGRRKPHYHHYAFPSKKLGMLIACCAPRQTEDPIIRSPGSSESMSKTSEKGVDSLNVYTILTILLLLRLVLVTVFFFFLFIFYNK